MFERVVQSTFGIYGKQAQRLVQWIVLALLVLQTSSHSLLIKYSRRASVAGAVKYSPATTVFMVEFCKTILCLVEMAFWEYRGNVWHNVRQLLLSSFMIIPTSLIYTLQNNLVFVALHFLDAATFQVMYQSKILTTALFSVFLLGKRLTVLKWISLVLLVQGVILVELPPCGSTDEHASNKFIGFTVVCILAMTSAFAGVYFEKLLKSTQVRLVSYALSFSLRFSLPFFCLGVCCCFFPLLQLVLVAKSSIRLYTCVWVCLILMCVFM